MCETPKPCSLVLTGGGQASPAPPLRTPGPSPRPVLVAPGAAAGEVGVSPPHTARYAVAWDIFSYLALGFGFLQGSSPFVSALKSHYIKNTFMSSKIQSNQKVRNDHGGSTSPACSAPSRGQLAPHRSTSQEFPVAAGTNHCSL